VKRAAPHATKYSSAGITTSNSTTITNKPNTHCSVRSANGRARMPDVIGAGAGFNQPRPLPGDLQAG
jgi:hypothetical protein